MRTFVWVGVSNMSRVRQLSTRQGDVEAQMGWGRCGGHCGTLLNIRLTEPAMRSTTAWQPPAISPWNPLQHSHLARLPLGFSQQRTEHSETAPIANSEWGLPAHKLLCWHLFLWGPELTQKASMYSGVRNSLDEIKKFWKMLQNG